MKSKSQRVHYYTTKLVQWTRKRPNMKRFERLQQYKTLMNSMLLEIMSNSLNNVVGVDEASEIWNLSPGYIKNLCADGKIQAKKIGKTWVIDRNQPNPSKSSD